MIDKPMKRCSTSLVIKENQIETNMIHFILNRMAVIKNTNKSIRRQEKINYNYNMFYINNIYLPKILKFSAKFAVSKIKENKQGLKQHRLHAICALYTG